MKILLTGGAGYIGSHTAVELLNDGCDVVTADNYSNSSPVCIERIMRICSRPVSAYTADVCDAASLDEVFRENADIDAVIHFAGFKAVGESVREPLKYYSNNLGSTITLLRTMEKYGVKKLIFSSSATVYSVSGHPRLTELSDTGGCSSPYGATKLMCEQIISDYAAAHGDFSAVLLRYFNPVGAHESGLIGEDPHDVPNNLMPYITQVAIGKLPVLNVFGSDYPTRDGTGVRDYIHVTDLARGHVSALKYCLGRTGVEVFNLGTGMGVSVLELVNAFTRVNGVDVPYRICPRREGDLAEYYADPNKAEHILGWRALRGPMEMCRDAWHWQKNNPHGYEK